MAWAREGIVGAVPPVAPTPEPAVTPTLDDAPYCCCNLAFSCSADSYEAAAPARRSEG